MTAPRKTILFILQRAPYGSASSRETLDAALAAAAFDQRVQLLFSGESVWQLLPEQDGSAIDSKDQGRMLGALAFYDIDEIYLDAHAAQRLLPAGQALLLAAQPLDEQGMRELVRAADCVFSL